jgi:hypothetical protein
VTFLPVRIEVPPRAAPTPVAAAPIELVLPDGAVVRVSPSFDATTLTRLLDVLRGSQTC